MRKVSNRSRREGKSVKRKEKGTLTLGRNIEPTYANNRREKEGGGTRQRGQRRKCREFEPAAARKHH